MVGQEQAAIFRAGSKCVIKTLSTMMAAHVYKNVGQAKAGDIKISVDAFLIMVKPQPPPPNKKGLKVHSQ